MPVIRNVFLLLMLALSPTLSAQYQTVCPVNPGMPVIGFSGNYGAGLESQSPFRVKVFLNQPVAMDVTINYTATGSAQNGQDFSMADSLLVIPAGQTSGTIEFPVVNDADIEGDETINIILSNPQNAVLGQSVYTYVIKRSDHDLDTPPPPPVLTMLQGPNGKSATLKLSSTYPQDIRVDYQITVTETGSGYTHNLSANTVIIPHGQTQAQITIPDLDDTIEVPTPSTVTIYLNNPVNVTLNNPMVSFSR
jgi:hypothetical protein